jgi:Flp pilus assembly protein TadD
MLAARLTTRGLFFSRMLVVMNATSSNCNALVQAAYDAIAHNDSRAAEDACRLALAIDPAHIEALGVLGFLLHSAGRFTESEEVFAKLVEVQPAEPSHWMNLGTARRCGGRLDEALVAFANASSRGADSADFFYNVGLTHIDRKDFESGLSVLAQAVALAPDDAEIRYRYALCCYERLRTEEALAALEYWDNLSGLTPEVVANIGLLLMNLGAPERAEPAVRQAVAEAGSDPQPLLTLIQLLERTNRLAEAIRLLPQLIAHPAAHTLGTELTLMRAQLAQRGSEHETARTLFAELLADCKEPHLAHLLQFPLAKSLDALERHGEAVETLHAAHRSQINLLRMTAPVLIARGAPNMFITRFGCDPEDIAAWDDSVPPPLEASPVFIVAFPRSGTTLLELTLDSHPQLVSMDEQPFIQNALDDMVAEGVSYPERLSGLSAEQLNGVRAKYWERVRRKVTLQPGQRLVDKNPLNILRLPVIRRLFPKAPVILAIRHPCDVILSCYMQHFRAPDFAILCSDFQALAVGFRRTFDFWYEQKELLEPRSMELRYETFTRLFQEQIREILEFLELPWNDAVLRPQETARDKKFISTPSYSQVIQPVSSKAVGRWHSYEKDLSKVLPIIEPYLERWGYEGLGSSNSR